MKGRLLLAISVLLCSAGAAVAGSGGLGLIDCLDMFEDLKISDEEFLERIKSFMSEEIAKRDDGDIRDDLIIQLSDFEIMPAFTGALKGCLSSDNLADLVLQTAKLYIGEAEVPLDSFLQERPDIREELDKAIASMGRNSVAAGGMLQHLCETRIPKKVDLDKVLCDETSLLFGSGIARFLCFVDLVMKDKRARQKFLSSNPPRCLSHLCSDKKDHDDSRNASDTKVDSRHYDRFNELMNSCISILAGPELREAIVRMEKRNTVGTENPAPAAQSRGFFDRQYRRIRDKFREFFRRL